MGFTSDNSNWATAATAAGESLNDYDYIDSGFFIKIFGGHKNNKCITIKHAQNTHAVRRLGSYVGKAFVRACAVFSSFSYNDTRVKLDVSLFYFFL